jgi:hypothetical protein
MDTTSQMVHELKQMMDSGEVEEKVKKEIHAIIQGLESGEQHLNDYYGGSTPGKVLAILDEVNQRIKR